MDNDASNLVFVSAEAYVEYCAKRLEDWMSDEKNKSIHDTIMAKISIPFKPFIDVVMTDHMATFPSYVLNKEKYVSAASAGTVPTFAAEADAHAFLAERTKTHTTSCCKHTFTSHIKIMDE